jgi:hypothetical protein
MAEELPCRLRTRLDELFQVPGRHEETGERSDCGNGGSAFALADERELAEVIAWMQPAEPGSASAHLGFSFDDDEESDPAHLALSYHLSSRARSSARARSRHAL